MRIQAPISLLSTIISLALAIPPVDTNHSLNTKAVAAGSGSSKLSRAGKPCEPCTNSCKIACKEEGKSDCKCANFCDSLYSCPTNIPDTAPVPAKPKVVRIRIQLPSKPRSKSVRLSSAGTPCEPCTNSCKIACEKEGKSDCKCSHFCDPHYSCPITAASLMAFAKENCEACTNSCKVACRMKGRKDCKCVNSCDPVYSCTPPA